MKALAFGVRTLVLVSLAAACADPTTTITPKAGNPLANSESSAIRPWITLTPDALVRKWPAAATVGEDFFVMGGWTGSITTPDLSMFDTGLGTWTPLAPMPNPVHGSLGAQTLAGQIYIVGGMPPSGILGSTVSVYDPPSNTWSTTTSLPVTAGCGGSGVIAGTLYALTGCEVTGLTTSGSLYSYSRQTHQWTTLQPNPIPRTFPAVVAAGGKLYAVGGVLQNGRTAADVNVFNPATGVWQTKASMPIPRQGAVAFPYGPKVVVVGGYDFNGNSLDDTWLYDPATDSWVNVPTIGFVSRGYFAGVVAAGAAYAVGGFTVFAGSGTIRNTLQRIFP